ncbi:acetoacetyl-synthetase [Lynx pardinus]|uniref:Acetoacetyl-synthetase n=1 Tax=Lynx pardinus TaxID=191816 RepID=A0A485NN16_LYNPA|nr:acetoacetyl-CoA synthetase isoform X3 [Lynx canadensis]VFV35191.1 acetoacetyl-synthetase [Lynx pardinus]
MSKQPRAGGEEILECQVMWEPDGKKNTQMDRFRAAVGAACGLALENYDDLYHWSVESYSDFWAKFWKFSGIIFSRMYDEVVDTSKGIADVPEWFRGSRLNYAENLLRHEENDKVALYAAREGEEEIVKVTFEELRQQVALFAAAMRKMGVKQGDRVVGYLPNGVHAVEAMLAAASIGAIWSSTSPDFGVNGTLIQHLKEHILHGNMNSSDTLLYYTTVGWMMWNWMVSALATGAALVLYDGSPLVPTPNVLWDLVDRLGITILGTGAKWLAVLEEKDLKPMETHSLQTLHTVLSTGSPLKAQSYDYVCRCIKSSVLLGSISGGTDIISCFMGQNFSVPVYRGEIQARNLGMAVEAWNEEGKAVWGESGELVCTKPIPCQPTHFWNDENGSKYRKAYFSRFPGVWAHGDYCRINPKTGGIVMLGRSDGTLNPNGVRFGSSEIYNIVQQGRGGEGASVPEDGVRPRLRARPGEEYPQRHPPRPLRAARAQRHPGDQGHPVHPQRQEGGSGGEAGHCWKGRGAPRGLLEPRHPGLVQGHPRAAGLLSGTGSHHARPHVPVL